LKAVVLNNNRFAGEHPQQKRKESGTGNVDHVSGVDQLQQLDEAGLAENSKRKQPIIKVFGKGLRY